MLSLKSAAELLLSTLHSKYAPRYDRVTVTNNEEELKRLQKGFGGYSPEMSKVFVGRVQMKIAHKYLKSAFFVH